MNFSLRTTIYTVGILAIIMGLFMLVPAYVEFLDNNANYQAFCFSSMISVFSGFLLFLAAHDTRFTLTVKEGFFLTTVSWVVVSMICSLPFMLSNIHLSFADAYFESVSGITTTGSTILAGLDQTSRGILLWRSITQWLGGMGIVAFAIILLPFLKIGGMQLFQTESSDRSEKIFPKAKSMIFSIVTVYCALTVLCLVFYAANGMTLFDSINHAMTTISTGGFSTHDSSFGYFSDQKLQLICTVFMAVGAMPFVLYVRMISSRDFRIIKDAQVKLFLGIIAAITFVLSLYLAFSSDFPLWDGAVLVIFNVVSVLTTTGYATADYTLWGSVSVGIFFFLTYLGGCAGSTSGGAKMMRLLVGFRVAEYQLKKLIYPNGVFAIAYQGAPLDIRQIQSTMVFGGLYVFANIALFMILLLTGLDLETAISGAATAIANVGPGIGSTIGPAGNFSSLPDAAKWTLSAGMIVGRLEILTVLVLFAPAYWKY